MEEKNRNPVYSTRWNILILFAYVQHQSSSLLVQRLLLLLICLRPLLLPGFDGLGKVNSYFFYRWRNRNGIQRPKEEDGGHRKNLIVWRTPQSLDLKIIGISNQSTFNKFISWNFREQSWKIKFKYDYLIQICTYVHTRLELHYVALITNSASNFHKTKAQPANIVDFKVNNFNVDIFQ